MAGWCGDAAATFAIGHIDAEVQRLLDVTRQVLHLSINLMGQRKWWSEVAREMENYVKKHSFFGGRVVCRPRHRTKCTKTPRCRTSPANAFRRSNDFRLVPGLVIAVEPMVNMGTKDVRCQSWTTGRKRLPMAAHAISSIQWQ